MRGFGFGAGAAAAIAATSVFMGSVSAQRANVDPIVIKGSKFFYKTNGTQFYIRGVAYQQDYSGTGSVSSTTHYRDPLADAQGCRRDLPYLVQLQTNTVRVYAIDPTQNHDACMNAFANAGIYVIADLSQPSESINRDSPTWNDELYARYTSVVDVMSKYSNTLGFFGGNEVSNAPNNTAASAFVKAAVRDTKAYIKQQNYRTIGVGYATNDDASIRVNMADYFNCGDQSDAIDFWGYNIYSWCGDSSYQESGYADRTKEFSSYSVPAFFAEYGCNKPAPRMFTEVQELYGPRMSPVWSGGIVYMYFQEANDYGLVSASDNSVSTLADFSHLSSQIAKVSPTGVQMNNYSPSNSPVACPTQVDSWDTKATPLPPTPNQELCSCMYNSLGCVVKSSVNAMDYGQLFGTVCGLGDSVCAGIAANASTGTYGAYGMCNATEQLAHAFNNYAQSQPNNPSACDFGGAATTQAAVSAQGNCASLVSQAGTGGTGTVTSAPTGTGAGSAGSGSGSGAGSAASSSGAAGIVSAPGFQSGIWQLVAYVALAALSGMGMILL